ncbi:hypothetical protein SOVF_009570, partial [Spinacia oleracea]
RIDLKKFTEVSARVGLTGLTVAA